MFISLFYNLPSCFVSVEKSTSVETSTADSATTDPTTIDSAADTALPPWTTPPCSASLSELFTEQSLHFPSSGSEGYTNPATEFLELLTGSLQHALAGSYEEAWTEALNADYTLCQGTDADAGTLIWQPSGLESGRPMIAVREAPSRAVIIEAPHPLYDSSTLEESIELFDVLSGQALIISGTHRCASSLFSGCSGTTSTCGTAQGYTISDPAHNAESAFQHAHVLLSEHFSSSIVINLHGMSGDGVSVSNGTKLAVADDSLVARLSEELKLQLGEENTTTCNSYSTANVDERLCGTTNTQGRHINGSEDPCEEAATTASERFLHIEQSRALRDDPTPLFAALESTVP